MTKRFWRIRGYDGLKTVFDISVGLGQFTDGQIKHLLRALAAKAGLNNRAIVGAYAKRKTTIANGLLDVQKDLRHPTYTCGINPFFTASVVDERGKIGRHSKL